MFGGNFWGKSDKTERERQGKFVQIGRRCVRKGVFGLPENFTQKISKEIKKGDKKGYHFVVHKS